MKMMIFIIPLLLLLSNCSKETPLINIPEEPIEEILLCDEIIDESNLVVDWCNLLHPDTLLVEATTVLELYNDQLFFIGGIGGPGENQNLYIYSTIDGSLINMIPIDAKRRTGNHITSYNNYLIASYFASGIEVYDMDTHEMVWSYEPAGTEKNRQWINIVGSEIIVPIIHGELPYHDASTIAAFDIKTGQRRDIFTVSKEEFSGGSPHVESVQVDTLSNGEVMFYFSVTVLQKDVLETNHFWAYNSTTNEYDWKIMNIDPIIVHNDPPIIYEDAITILGTNSHTINKYTGEIINTVDISGDYGFCAPLLYNGRVYAKAAQGNLTCLDAATGDLIWDNENAAGRFPQNQLTIFNDRIYYSGLEHELVVVDINTGELLYKERSPFSGGRFFLGGQVIDPDTEYMYTDDGYRVMRLELLR